jgi:hypothetical protein
MKLFSSMIVLLAALAATNLATPCASAQQQLRLAWRDTQARVTDHDQRPTDDIIRLEGRELAINLTSRSTWAWIEGKHTVCFISFWKKVKDPTRWKLKKNKGRLYGASLHHIYTIIITSQ